MAPLKFARLRPEAVLPTRGSKGSCGLDIYSAESVNIPSLSRHGVRSGLSVRIPDGFYGRIAPRSGLAVRAGIDVMAGVIDADYRGEIICLLVNLGSDTFHVEAGDRVAQLIIEKVAVLEPIWHDSLDETDRGVAGFGSTGR